MRAEAAARDTPETFEAGQFVFESPSIRVGAPFAQYAAASFTAGRPFLSAVEDLSRRIFTEFHYDRRATTIGTPVDEVLGSRRGVCQDFAHLMIACLRLAGFRSDEQCDAAWRAFYSGVGPRLFRRLTGERRGAGRRRASDQRVGGRVAAAGLKCEQAELVHHAVTKCPHGASNQRKGALPFNLC